MSTINDLEELNNLLAADPALRRNMQEMGFIKWVPFVTDHNGALSGRWELTPYGEQEMRERDLEAAMFLRSKLQ